MCNEIDIFIVGSTIWCTPGHKKKTKLLSFMICLYRLVNMKTVCAYIPFEQTKQKNKYNHYITVCTMIHKVKLWIVFLALEKIEKTYNLLE